MRLGKINNVSFGYKLSPQFVESTRWCHGNQPRRTLIYKLENAGNSDAIIHTKVSQIYNNKDYDLMIFPKYRYKKRVYGGLRNMENLQKAEKEVVEEILLKAAKRGQLKEVKSALLEDFSNLKKTIVGITQNPKLVECNLLASQKQNLFKTFLKYFRG